MNLIKDQKGFTLIELMLVILIIGILILIAQPIYSQAKAGAERAACQANVRTMEGALETWKALNTDSNYPSNVTIISTLVDQGYIKSTPICPAGGTYNCSGGGGSTSPTIECSLAEHSYP